MCEALDHESGKCQAGGGGGKKGWMKGGAAAPPAAPAAHELDTFEVPYDILLVGVGAVLCWAGS